MLNAMLSLPLAMWKTHHVRLEYEDKVVEGDYLYGMVSNTTSVGRFKNFPPGHPDLSDGLLEVTLISPMQHVEDVAEAVPALLTLDPTNLDSMLTTFSTPKVKITSEGGLSWTLDGEDGGVHEVAEIEALHNAYRIVHGNGPAEKSGK